MAIAVTIQRDQVAAMMKRVEDLTKNEVLVGIPASGTARTDKGPDNALIGYVHEFGSPARNIPARPFLLPGIAKAADAIASSMLAGGRRVMTGAEPDAMKVLHRAGMIARNAVVREITSPAPAYAPLAYRTVRARLMRTKAGQRKLRQIVNDAKAQRMTAQQAVLTWAQGNVKILIDTGQLRAAITYVVRRRR